MPVKLRRHFSHTSLDKEDTGERFPLSLVDADHGFRAFRRTRGPLSGRRIACAYAAPARLGRGLHFGEPLAQELGRLAENAVLECVSQGRWRSAAFWDTPRHARERARRHRLRPPQMLHARTRQQLEELTVSWDIFQDGG